MHKNCATSSIVTSDRQTSRNALPLRNPPPRQWQSTRTARKTNQPQDQRVASCRIENPADLAGFGDR